MIDLAKIEKRLDDALTQETPDTMKKWLMEKRNKIPVYAQCTAAGNGGCFCTGKCQEIIGWVDKADIGHP